MSRHRRAAIAIDGLVKKFGAFTALDGLNLNVSEGEVHGFLGPNGAGKSTTIRVLLGLLRKNAGQVQLLGGDPWRDVVELHRRLAYVPGDVVLWPSLTGGEAIDLLGNLRGGLDENRRGHLVERFELDPTKRGRQYSKGNRQKVAIVAALSSDVELLILDEPTSGLDPLMEVVFQEEIAEEKARGRTVLLSSHIMSEVEVLADQVSIIRQGRIVQNGTLDDLRGQTRSTITATLGNPPPTVNHLDGFCSAHLEDAHFTGSAEAANVGAAVAQLLRYGLTALTVTPPSLEELFLQQYTSADAVSDTGTEGPEVSALS
ncbi:MAG: ABC transporter ATP-binding protein [Mycobacterium sp.]